MEESVVKQETADSEDEGSASAVKQEMDIGPIVLQPADLQVMSRPFKLEPVEELPARAVKPRRKRRRSKIIAAAESSLADAINLQPCTSRRRQTRDLKGRNSIQDSVLTKTESESEDESEEEDSSAGEMEDIFNEVAAAKPPPRAERDIVTFDLPDDAAEADLHLVNLMTAADDEALEDVIRQTHPELLQFDWVNDFSQFRGARETFTGHAGPTVKCDIPVELFLKTWDREIMTTIVDQTNVYGDSLVTKSRANRAVAVTKRSNLNTKAAAGEALTDDEERYLKKKLPRIFKWRQTNVDEMYALLKIFILQSIVRVGKESEYFYNEYNSRYLHMDFGKIIPYNRFTALKRALHFVDNRNFPESILAEMPKDEAKLVKVMPIIEHCNRKFQEQYSLEQNIAIDESLTMWKGKLSFMEYIKSKAAKFDIDSFEVCESRTGYLWRILFYAGKDNDSSETRRQTIGGKTSLIVLKLMDGLFDKGHTLYMDNFYNSPQLARLLKSRGTDCVGTLRTSRKNVPQPLKVIKKGAMGALLALHCGDVALMAWRDVPKVTLISTCHGVDAEEGTRPGKKKNKSVAVHEYNTNTGGVDMKNQQLSAFPLECIGISRWYIKIFKRLLNVSILNSYIIYVASRPGGAPILDHRKFRRSIVNGLDVKLAVPVPPQYVDRPERKATLQTRQVLPNNHCPVQSIGRSGAPSRSTVCVLCYSRTKKKVRSRFTCNRCQVPLCLLSCFRDWHVEENLT